MEPFGVVGIVLGSFTSLVLGGLLFAAYKLGILYQLFHKVGILKKVNTVICVLSVLSFVMHSVFSHCIICGHLKKKVFYRQSVLKRKLDSIHVNFDQPCGFPAQRLSDPRGSTSTLQPWTICGCCIIGNDSGMKRSVTGGPTEHSQLFILGSGFILVCTIVYVVTTATILSAVT